MKYADLLWAPPAYWELDPIEKEDICNGVGPRGFGFLIPDTIWGLSVTEAADIHDYMYEIGEYDMDKIDADDVFLNNMVRIIEKQTKWNWLKKLRCRRARVMYHAVTHFGGPAFWANKTDAGSTFNEIAPGIINA